MAVRCTLPILKGTFFVLGVGFDSNSKWFSNGQYSVCFRIEYSNRIEYFIRTVIVYVYVGSPSQAKRKVRDSTYALRTSKNIRFEFETIFECRKIRKTLKVSNFESNIFSNPTPSSLCDASVALVVANGARCFRYAIGTTVVTRRLYGRRSRMATPVMSDPNGTRYGAQSL